MRLLILWIICSLIALYLLFKKNNEVTLADVIFTIIVSPFIVTMVLAYESDSIKLKRRRNIRKWRKRKW